LQQPLFMQAFCMPAAIPRITHGLFGRCLCAARLLLVVALLLRQT
jgi:hypothetical protein